VGNAGFVAHFVPTAINFLNTCYFPGPVNVHRDVTGAEEMPREATETKSTVTSDQTATETQELPYTQPVSKTRRSFEDIGSICSTTEIKKERGEW
jgi:hypothetical protein